VRTVSDAQGPYNVELLSNSGVVTVPSRSDLTVEIARPARDPASRRTSAPRRCSETHQTAIVRALGGIVTISGFMEEEFILAFQSR
jgi:hypothetical protein